MDFNRINRQALYLSTILLLGLLLRTVGLDSKSISYDEALEIRLAEKIFSVMYSPSSFQKELMAEVPLYPVLLRLWMFLGKSDFAVRFFSAVLGVFSIFIAYLLTKRLFDKKVALIAAYLVAISPLSIFYTRLARIYSLFGLLTLLSTYMFLRVLNEKKLTIWLAYVVCTAGLIYTHYYAVFVVLFQNLYIVFQWRKDLFKKWITSQISIGVLFLPWVGIFLKQFLTFAPSVMSTDPFPVPFGVVGKFLFTFYTFCLGMTVVPWNIPVVLVAAGVFLTAFFLGINWLRVGDRRGLFFLLLYLLCPIVSIVLIGYAMPRYFFNISPAFYIITAVGISKIFRGSRYKCIGVVALITLLNSYSLYNYFTDRQFINMVYTEPWREVAKEVELGAERSDVIIHSHYANPSFQYYYKEDTPNIFANGKFVRESAGEVFTNYKRIWYIKFSSGLSPDDGDDLENLIKSNSRLLREIKYQKDDQVDFKRKYIKKDFVDYRIIVSLYEIDKNSGQWTIM